MALQEADTLFELGIKKAKEKDFEKAAQLLEKAIVAAPFRYDIYYHLGNTFTALGKINEAIKHLDHVLRLKPEHAEAHNNLGRIFHRQNNFEKAYYHYQAAIQAREHYSDAEFNLGLLWVKQGKRDFARKQFESLLSWYPNLSIVYEQLAQLALQDTDLLQAKYYYKKRLKYPITSSDTWNNIGAVFSQIGEYDEAINAFTNALDMQPEHIEARNNRAALYLEKSRLKEAIWEYTLYLRLAPQDATGHYNLGVALMLSGRLQEAIDAFLEAIRLYPDYLDARCNLGAIYIQQSKLKLAYEAYQAVLAKAPHHETAAFMVSALSQSEALQSLSLKEVNHIPKTAPLSYVKDLFNHYADYFEQHLKNLDYQVPQKLYHWMQPYLKNKKFNALDLGCGTGLTGVAFQSNLHEITGVDIAPNMLKEAAKKSLYTNLIEKDILSFLKETKVTYELILSADTLVYFGDLTEIMEGAFKLAASEGYFVFSVEILINTNQDQAHEGAYYRLQTTGRYQHALEGIQKVAEQAGWQWINSFSIKGRLHQDHSIVSGLCLLQKPS